MWWAFCGSEDEMIPSMEEKGVIEIKASIYGIGRYEKYETGSVLA